MSEIDLVLVNETDQCTIYTIQFKGESQTEFENFYNKFKDDAIYNPDLMRIVAFINKIAQNGAFERFFRPEGKMSDHVVALQSSPQSFASTAFASPTRFSSLETVA